MIKSLRISVAIACVSLVAAAPVGMKPADVLDVADDVTKMTNGPFCSNKDQKWLTKRGPGASCDNSAKPCHYMEHGYTYDTDNTQYLNITDMNGGMVTYRIEVLVTNRATGCKTFSNEVDCESHYETMACDKIQKNANSKDECIGDQHACTWNNGKCGGWAQICASPPPPSPSPGGMCSEELLFGLLAHVNETCQQLFQGAIMTDTSLPEAVSCACFLQAAPSVAAGVNCKPRPSANYTIAQEYEMCASTYSSPSPSPEPAGGICSNATIQNLMTYHSEACLAMLGQEDVTPEQGCACALEPKPAVDAGTLVIPDCKPTPGDQFTIAQQYEMCASMSSSPSPSPGGMCSEELLFGLLTHVDSTCQQLFNNSIMTDTSLHKSVSCACFLQAAPSVAAGVNCKPRPSADYTIAQEYEMCASTYSSPSPEPAGGICSNATIQNLMTYHSVACLLMLSQEDVTPEAGCACALEPKPAVDAGTLVIPDCKPTPDEQFTIAQQYEMCYSMSSSPSPSPEPAGGV